MKLNQRGPTHAELRAWEIGITSSGAEAGSLDYKETLFLKVGDGGEERQSISQYSALSCDPSSKK